MLTPPPPGSLRGEESFDGTDATVLDFWRFAMSDLRTNNVRGYLAEFLVARALGADHSRVEWNSWDVTTPSGLKVEVKTSSYLQSWAQRRWSTPTFRVPPTRTWDDATGRSATASYNADVYVFCLQTATTHNEYDPLSTEQWSFYVADRRTIEDHPGQQIGLATLTRLTGPPVSYPALADAVTMAAGRAES